MAVHAMMCLAMIPMLWSWESRVPHGPQVALLGASSLWCLLQAFGTRRPLTLITEAHHALVASLMVWMVISIPAGHDMPAMAHAQMSMPAAGAPLPLVVVISAYCFATGALWLVATGLHSSTEQHTRTLPTTAGHAVMSISMGIATLTMA